jgi:hypothetical protein
LLLENQILLDFLEVDLLAEYFLFRSYLKDYLVDLLLHPIHHLNLVVVLYLEPHLHHLQLK